jgi:hypothetical protein
VRQRPEGRGCSHPATAENTPPNRPVQGRPAGGPGVPASFPGKGGKVGRWLTCWDEHVDNRSQFAVDARALGELSSSTAGAEYADNGQMAEGVRATRLERSLRPDPARRFPCEITPLGPEQPEAAWLIQQGPGEDKLGVMRSLASAGLAVRQQDEVLRPTPGISACGA